MDRTLRPYSDYNSYKIFGAKIIQYTISLRKIQIHYEGKNDYVDNF